MGINIIFDIKPHIWMDWGTLLIFYGLYFGVLGRDIAEICADKMASHIGVSTLLYLNNFILFIYLILILHMYTYILYYI
jgi:hypothetical protein